MSAHKTLLFSLAGLTLLTGCNPAATTPDSHGQKVSAYTTAANQQLQQQLPLADQQDFNDARRGLIASQQPLRVSAERNPDQSVWDMTQYAFIQGEAPDSVNPSLWRQAKLNNIHGLFEVTPGIYQLRGFDLANMTLIKGDSGWIVIDPLTSRETAANAFRFAMQQLQPRYPQLTGISAVLFTHPHLDHFGGALGIISQQEIDQRHIPVIAPQGFMEEATSENIIAGNAMSRRAMFMYGKNLPRDIWGHVGSGLGKSPAFGEFSILQPNQLVDHTLQEMTIDGVDFRFQYTPESEAPAEFTFYLPQYRAFCGAEVMSRHMHNLYTPRGAKVRDAMKWSAYIEEARRLFADADIYFGSHHWPIWGQENIQTFLKQQRDTYKFIHDQTVRRMNQGMTAGEIAEDLTMPASLATVFSSRGYYGTLKHNARAVYQAYMGWYDGNPAHLDPLPDTARAAGYVDLAGGADALYSKASAAFADGRYRWSAELLNHLVFAQPDNGKARELLARNYDQLGYQAESGPWRDIYLTGAMELRDGKPDSGINLATMKEIFLQTPVSNFFDTLSVRLKAEDAADKDWRIAIRFTDLQQNYLLWIENAVLHYRPLAGNETPATDATLNLTHPLFVSMLTGEAGIKDTLFSDNLSVDGSTLDLIRFFSLFEQPDPAFAIVLPE